MEGFDVVRMLTATNTTQRELAAAIGLEPSKVNRIVKGHRKITSTEADKIRDYFSEKTEGVSTENAVKEMPRNTHNSTTRIPELDMRVGGASGGDLRVWDESMIDLEENHWQVPSDWASEVHSPFGQRLFILKVVGNSMAPDFPAGSRVLVNSADRQPSPPGPFVVFDGMSFVIKFVSVEPFSDPPVVRLASRDEVYPPYSRTIEEAHIQGRVVGHWVRT